MLFGVGLPTKDLGMPACPYHLPACHRSRKNHITKLRADDAVLFRVEQMANAVFDHFDSIFCYKGEYLNHIKLEELDLPPLQVVHLDHCFSEEEIWQAIVEMPTDKAPRPDGFTGLFYRMAWPIIKGDIFRSFQALWSLDGRSFFLVNHAYMVLLRKK